ncbi:eukaryotic membrane protein family-domain-containing protein [Gorgonomyces haynaldii]|nr:eukaryotic membrane protein family-domain-containing protein [Gorgonomyces haynaldii]
MTTDLPRLLDPSDSEDEIVEPVKPLTFLEYFRAELVSEDMDDGLDLKQERISNFLNVPFQIEQLMFIGVLVCLDSFLYIFTILPLRIVIALWLLLRSIVTWQTTLKASQKADLLKGALLALCTHLVSFLDPSKLYHSIRGQAIIKLYVIFNVLEICDKLCSAFGHDILDSLLSTATPDRLNKTSVKRRVTRLTLFFVAALYVFLHTLVLFYQVMSLNVAVNSYNNALFTLLLSNQFVEIKGSVFKRFERENLFQLSCSDMVERFQLAVFLCIITIRNFIEIIVVDRMYTVLTSKEMSLALIIFGPALLVYSTEILIDWLKHAFITKFNGIPPLAYRDFRDSLCRDLIGVDPTDNTDKRHSDRTPALAKRIGFVNIPLAALFIRVTVHTFTVVMTGTEPLDESIPAEEEIVGTWTLPSHLMLLFNQSDVDFAKTQLTAIVIGNWVLLATAVFILYLI